MKGAVKAIFTEHLIEYCEAIPFDECSVLYERKIASLGFSPQTAILFAIPYYAGEFCERNLSLYAVARDYHLFFEGFSRELTEALAALFPHAHFAAFSDNSPIDEREAAAKAGLGLKGKNRLLITEKYASYVFLGEVLTDLPYHEIGTLSDFTIKECEGCGACLAACPKKDMCLSALTQKKGLLTEEEEGEIRALGLAWGCDACQIVCPHTKHAEVTPIAFFKEALIPQLTAESLEAMSEDDFNSRAYAWRGRKTILRNLRLLSEE